MSVGQRYDFSSTFPVPFRLVSQLKGQILQGLVSSVHLVDNLGAAVTSWKESAFSVSAEMFRWRPVKRHSEFCGPAGLAAPNEVAFHVGCQPALPVTNFSRPPAPSSNTSQSQRLCTSSVNTNTNTDVDTITNANTNYKYKGSQSAVPVTSSLRPPDPSSQSQRWCRKEHQVKV